jgi:hypothetical protein
MRPFNVRERACSLFKISALRSQIQIYPGRLADTSQARGQIVIHPRKQKNFHRQPIAHHFTARNFHFKSDQKAAAMPLM